MVKKIEDYINQFIADVPVTAERGKTELAIGDYALFFTEYGLPRYKAIRVSEHTVDIYRNRKNPRPDDYQGSMAI